VEWLRDVRRFASAEQLQEQLERDRVRAQAALARRDPPIDTSHASHA